MWTYDLLIKLENNVLRSMRFKTTFVSPTELLFAAFSLFCRREGVTAETVAPTLAYAIQLSYLPMIGKSHSARFHLPSILQTLSSL